MAGVGVDLRVSEPTRDWQKNFPPGPISHGNKKNDNWKKATEIKANDTFVVFFFFKKKKFNLSLPLNGFIYDNPLKTTMTH